MKNNFKKILQKIKERRQIKKIRSTFPIEKDIVTDLVATNGFSMCPSLLQKIRELILNKNPRLIIEIGSGISTKIISKNIYPNSKLISIEEDKIFMKKTSDLIENLSNVEFLDSIKKIKMEEKIADLLIIDGPRGKRFSDDNIQSFKDMIGPKTIVIIDDTDRKENDMAAQKISDLKNLIKEDFFDPILKRQKYSILSPKK